MNELIILIAMLIVFALGFYRISSRIKEVKRKRQFAEGFLGKLQKYLNSTGNDSQSYTWLIQHSDKMQSELGSLGIGGFYHSPISNVSLTNFQIIVNLLPELRRSWGHNWRFPDPRLPVEYGALIQETLIRHVGVLDDERERIIQSQKNPVNWFREGVQLLLLLPFMVLDSFGIISSTRRIGISESPWFKLFSGLLALVSILGSVVGIVSGWNTFVTFMKFILNLK